MNGFNLLPWTEAASGVSLIVAYVDPGFLSTLSAVFTYLIFGVLATAVLRPFRYIRSLFNRRKEEAPHDDTQGQRDQR